MDWEFPTFAEREQFVLLLEEIKKAFEPFNKELSIAANPCLLTTTHGYDVPGIMKHVDFVSLMIYDLFSGAWNNNTANHGNFWHSTSRYNVQTCVGSWISSGAIKEKLIIGIPTYSRNFQLDDPANYDVGALATFKNFGKSGEIPATFSYNIICKNILENGWIRHYDRVKSTGPFAVSGTTWAGYDDVESIAEKVLYVIDNNHAGVAFWSLDHDDYSNSCREGTFPLIRSVWNYIS
jgi:chitinase